MISFFVDDKSAAIGDGGQHTARDTEGKSPTRLLKTALFSGSVMGLNGTRPLRGTSWAIAGGHLGM
ncbi:hypothetical protein HY36_17495 [Hyphomonas atlantica]|jgi:hypothetical protein|uniref:Uncharacterized protein n=1 Tax=Hyphomonas atlantica TaxID=1280948 RepID=A0A059E0U4_9PROT|nr:hypothetical protein HY36_17495 [Hyphomonas atlantica]